jgi:hypothetical protein
LNGAVPRGRPRARILAPRAPENFEGVAHIAAFGLAELAFLLTIVFMLAEDAWLGPSRQ